MSDFDAVLKVGGSLSRGEALTALAGALARLGERYRLLVVPGGGEFADAVRVQYRRYHLGETAAHRMALLAMDQYGYLLADIVPNSQPVRDLWSARSAVAAGSVAVLLPASLLLQADPLPHSWEVTSDSLGAWIAGLARADRYVLLKDVDGLYEEDPKQADAGNPIRELTVAQLAARRGGVDPCLAAVLATLEIETWVINGERPERLAELLESGATTGTRIVRR